MAKVIASVGAHKTGTSLLQHHFKWRTDHYVRSGLDSLTRNEIAACVGRRGLTEKPDKLANAIDDSLKKSGCDSLFFCFEDMFGKPFSQKTGLYAGVANGAPILREALSNFDAHIVYAIRPQWEFIESYYLQKVHEGYYKAFNQFVENLELENLSWFPIIDTLREHFGPDKVGVVDFREIRKGQTLFIKKIIHEFISRDITIAEVDSKVHNPSISDRGLQIALRINPLLKPGGDEVGKVRRFLQSNFSNRYEPRPNLLSLELKERLMGLYLAEYESLTEG